MMRILAATDGSPHAKRAAELAARLARELRACEVVLVNAGHIPAIALGGPGADMMVDYGMLEEGFEKAGLAILEETKTVFHGVDVPVTAQYWRGEPSHEILAAAAEVKADLIVMGSRGLGQIGGLILGSVSERVLHGAHIPVLIVR
ncbi:MAG TPA: universal stress protein [bacterium]|nr:universal stress protein [bacterium]